MSADNAYVVFADDNGWHATHAFLSPMEEDCQYLKGMDDLISYQSEDEAALAAYHLLKEDDDLVEYGIISAGHVPPTLCGKCLACREGRNQHE